MFQAQLPRCLLIKKVIEAIKDLLVDGSWECTNEGMSLQEMDSSHVILISLLLKRDGFDKYVCERNVTISTKISSMLKILKCSNNNDRLTMTAKDVHPDTFTFTFESTDRIAEYDLKLLDLEYNILTIPDMDHSCIINLPSTEFRQICKDLSLMGSTVNIYCTTDAKVKFSASGDVGTGNVTLGCTENDAITVKIREPVVLTFSLQYMNLIAKATIVSERVSLYLTQDAPLMAEYEMVDMGYIRYYLAALVCEDDEK